VAQLIEKSDHLAPNLWVKIFEDDPNALILQLNVHFLGAKIDFPCEVARSLDANE